MEVRKMRQIARIACAGLGMVALSTPAFAQEAAGLNFIDMAANMGPIAMGVAVVLFIMSFWSVGVAIERIYTYNQARKQSKLYAPQVAKHLKDGRLQGRRRALRRRRIPLQSPREVVLAACGIPVPAGDRRRESQS